MADKSICGVKFTVIHSEMCWSSIRSLVSIKYRMEIVLNDRTYVLYLVVFHYWYRSCNAFLLGIWATMTPHVSHFQECQLRGFPKTNVLMRQWSLQIRTECAVFWFKLMKMHLWSSIQQLCGATCAHQVLALKVGISADLVCLRDCFAFTIFTNVTSHLEYSVKERFLSRILIL